MIEEHGGVLLLIGECALNDPPHGIGVICAESVGMVDSARCVVVMGENARLPVIVSAAAVLINGDSEESLPVERLNGIQLITCGRTGKNTVSLSSNAGESVTVALNRAVMTFAGICEPLELPVVRSPGASDYGCMAAAAAGIIFGAEN